MANDYIPITTGDSPTSGLLGAWWRKPPHVIRKGAYAPLRGEGLRHTEYPASVIVPTGKKTYRYDPIQADELLDALLKVAQGDLKAVEFADQYGLLGYNYIVPEVNRCKGGDPLNWFLATARTVHAISELIARIKGEREEERDFLAEYLREEIPNGPYALGGRVVEVPLRRRASKRNLISVATNLTRYLLNGNLGTTGRRLQATGNGLRTVFTFRALVDVVYWQLADQIGNSAIQRCAECGRIFIAKNSRSRFCPPTGGKKISRCKTRFNVREFRKSQQRKGKRK